MSSIVLKASAAGDAPATIPVARPLLPTTQALAPYLARIDEARWYSDFGPLLTLFEERLGARFERPTAVATTASGTTALTLALQAASGEGGGLCAMPSWTARATALAVLRAGLTPWFLDVDPDTWMLDPDATVAALRHAPGPVAAITPVAAFGALPDLDAWAAVSREARVPVVVDAAAAFDAIAAAPVPLAVSLHAGKSLGVGEGGVVASEDAGLVERIRQLSSFGFHFGREAEFSAGNAKMSEYAAAVGLAGLDAWPQTRRRLAGAAQQLRVALALTPQIVFQKGWGTHWVSGACVVGAPQGTAGQIAASLAAVHLGTRAWKGCHAQEAFAACPREPAPVTDRLAASTLGLPFFVDMDEAEAWRIVDGLMLALGEA